MTVIERDTFQSVSWIWPSNSNKVVWLLVVYMQTAFPGLLRMYYNNQRNAPLKCPTMFPVNNTCPTPFINTFLKYFSIYSFKELARQLETHAKTQKPMYIFLNNTSAGIIHLRITTVRNYPPQRCVGRCL